jgi:hypothetical protein
MPKAVDMPCPVPARHILLEAVVLPKFDGGSCHDDSCLMVMPSQGLAGAKGRGEVRQG